LLDEGGIDAVRGVTTQADCDDRQVTLAAMIPNSGPGPDTLIKQADEALYQAKERSRNQAVMAPQKGPESFHSCVTRQLWDANAWVSSLAKQSV
jgi:hypothetical protein